MIIEYDKKYDEQIKNLLVELQEHIVCLDIEKYNILGEDYGNLYFKQVMEEVERFEGKIYLYEENSKILGFVEGIINNEENETFELKVPKRGRVSELVVAKEARGKGIGDKLLNKMEQHFLENGCKDVLLAVFAYNDGAERFYKNHGYHSRMITMTKTIEK